MSLTQITLSMEIMLSTRNEGFFSACHSTKNKQTWKSLYSCSPVLCHMFTHFTFMLLQTITKMPSLSLFVFRLEEFPQPWQSLLVRTMRANYRLYFVSLVSGEKWCHCLDKWFLRNRKPTICQLCTITNRHVKSHEQAQCHTRTHARTQSCPQSCSFMIAFMWRIGNLIMCVILSLNGHSADILNIM